MDINIIRHSLAHVMASVVEKKFKGVKFGIGPAIENGFYYDFDLKETLSEKELGTIESEMRNVIKQNLDFTKKEIAIAEAKKLFKNQPYKLELIEELALDNKTVSIYTVGEFTDLCLGPHVLNTKELRNTGFKLVKVNGAYWKGSEKNKMMTRIYAYAFEDKAGLEGYLKFLEEAMRRDHRKIGPDLELFMLSDTSPGMPYWLPRGLTLFNTLVEFWRKLHKEAGYYEFAGPQVNSVNVWKTSGHWDHYRSGMFALIPGKGKTEPEFALKPMSCPNAIMVYKNKVRSYRELPLRFNDVDVIHRDESGGVLHGLLRVQMFRQDDSHNFITETQVESEFDNLFKLANEMYKVFGLKYRAVLSTRPEDFMGDIKLWDKAETQLKQVLNKHFGKGNYIINEGDGAFYGPKIDLWMKDALGRDWQMGTFQFDMQLPIKFECEYTSSDGQRKQPIIIHRTIYGSLERFVGLITEHFEGAFPFWISPVQVGIVPVNEKNFKYAKKIYEKLYEAGIRAEINLEEGNMGKKVNEYRKFKTPYTIVLGEKEESEKTISVKIRGGEQINGVKLNDFIKALTNLNNNKQINLINKF